MRPCPGGKLASFYAAMKRQRDAREQEQEQGMQPQLCFGYNLFKSFSSVQLNIQLMVIQESVTDHFNLCHVGRCLVQTGYYMNCNVFSVV